MNKTKKENDSKGLKKISMFIDNIYKHGIKYGYTSEQKKRLYEFYYYMEKTIDENNK